jgi:hypothetical protein
LSSDVIRAVFIVAGAMGALLAVLAWWRPRFRNDDEFRTVRLWLEHFSADSYRPMLRLADQRDALFLGARSGPEEAQRYSRRQRRILKEYLRGLSRDFHRLHLLVANSAPRVRNNAGNSSLTVLEEKMEFILSMWSIEFRLVLSGIVPCAINLRPMLANIDQLAARTRDIDRRRP